MAYVSLQYSGSPGVIRDLQPHILPENAWSECENMRMDNSSAQKIYGYKSVYETAQVSPLAVWFIPDPNQNWWVYCGTARVYATDGTTHYDITRRLTVPTALTGALAGAGAGNLSNGDYKYKVTFVNAEGETTVGAVSNTVTVADNSTDGQVSLTSIPVGTEDTVTARKIYRTEVGGSDYKLLTTISDNSTTTYTDNTADGSLGAAPPSTNSAVWEYSADSDLRWSGGVLSGILVLNNGIDTPQQWVPGSANTMTELENWPANTIARIVRPFGVFLFALDITKSGTRYPYMVKWSDAADPGGVPGSWDETSASVFAGEQDLGETSDKLVDCLPLRDNLIVYKEKSQYIAQFIGGTFVFRMAAISKLDGMFTHQCAAEFRPGFHAVFTHNDVIIHNGVTAESIIDGQNRRWLLDSVDSTYYQRCFCVHHERYNEFWICFPEVGSAGWCTRALIYNYREKTWGDRVLPGVSDIKPGIVTEGSDDTWNNGAAVTWDSSDGVEKWNQDRDAPTSNRLLMAYPDASPKLFWLGTTVTNNGTSYTGVLERTHLPITPMRQGNSRTPNYESWKFLRGVRPRFHNWRNSSSEVTMYIGTHNDLHANPTWYGPYTFTPAAQYKLDVTLSGRLFALRFEFDGDEAIQLDGIDLDIEVEADY